MNVPLCLVTIFFKTLPINFDETFRVLSRLPEDGTETFWENSIHKQKIFIKTPFFKFGNGPRSGPFGECRRKKNPFIYYTFTLNEWNMDIDRIRCHNTTILIFRKNLDISPAGPTLRFLIYHFKSIRIIFDLCNSACTLRFRVDFVEIQNLALL